MCGCSIRRIRNIWTSIDGHRSGMWSRSLFAAKSVLANALSPRYLSKTGVISSSFTREYVMSHCSISINRCLLISIRFAGTWRTTITIRSVWRSRIARTSRRWSGIATSPAACASRARARPDGRVAPETAVARLHRPRQTRRPRIDPCSMPPPNLVSRPYDRSQAASAAPSDSSWSYLCSWSSYALFLPFWYCYRFILKWTADPEMRLRVYARDTHVSTHTHAHIHTYERGTRRQIREGDLSTWW